MRTRSVKHREFSCRDFFVMRMALKGAICSVKRRKNQSYRSLFMMVSSSTPFFILAANVNTKYICIISYRKP